jgi:exodeoxyribonuclease-3
MKIISYNVNGIRAAMKKGLVDFLKKENADVICFQEIKALQSDINEKEFSDLGYECHWFSAEKKGYSGVGILSKQKPKELIHGTGNKFFDAEGRTIIAHFESVTLINTYFPSGTSGEERQSLKYQFLDDYFLFIADLKKNHPNLVIVGDYNIAHTDIDIHNPKGNKKTSGFLPEEREWMTKWFGSGMLDSFRFLHPETLHAYTWWSARFPSVRKENKGWRIDYISVTDNLKDSLSAAAIHAEAIHSDHCPISIELQLQ